MLEFEIIDYQQVTSTNEVMKKFISEGRGKEGTVILADFQTTGRGRGDHRWHSAPKENLLMSILLKPAISVQDHFFLNELVSLSVMDTLRAFGVSPGIKWPNDIYLQGKKLGGLLIENSLSGSRIRQSIIGLGLNLNATSFPSDLPNPISLRNVLGNEVDRIYFAGVLLDHLAHRYQLVRENQWELLHRNYLQKVLGLGSLVKFIVGGETCHGTLEDIRPQGEILIRSEENELKAYLYNEITLVL
ncbi:MAG: biotin--[acetyl-CoA-carboxylase] ligase [Bacteroidales bacterium]|nr:biotin--[acetyl-CoA-carboxylase] ligase [Bacteroidales bacterium]